MTEIPPGTKVIVFHADHFNISRARMAEFSADGVQTIALPKLDAKSPPGKVTFTLLSGDQWPADFLDRLRSLGLAQLIRREPSNQEAD